MYVFQGVQQPEAPKEKKANVPKVFSSLRPHNGVKFVRELWWLKFVMQGASWTVVQEKRFWMLFGRRADRKAVLPVSMSHHILWLSKFQKRRLHKQRKVKVFKGVQQPEAPTQRQAFKIESCGSRNQFTLKRGWLRGGYICEVVFGVDGPMKGFCS